MMKLGRSAVAVLALLLGLMVVSGRVQGQTATASLNGTVSDTSGGTVAGATLTLVDTRTNSSFSATSAKDGAYHFVDLPPGPAYALTIARDGFQTVTINGIYLPVSVATTKDVQLSVGQVTQTVEVTAEGGSVSLNTTNATIGNNLDMRAVANLPDEFRDDPSSLLRIQAGVVSAQTNSGQSVLANVDPNHTRDGAVAGARADQNNITVDGIDATDFAVGQAFSTQAAIPVDAIQEFDTQVAQSGVDFGGRSGAQTTITTKSGTNDWHGALFEYNRTAATEANTFFNNLNGVPRLALVRNQFGGNVGGPVLKDKLFFFFEYDGRRDRSAEGVLQFVPYPHVKLGEVAYINSGCPDTSRLTSADVSTSCVTIASAATVTSLDPCSTMSCAGAPGFVAPGEAPILKSTFANRYPTPNDFSDGDGLNIAAIRFNAPAPLGENGYVSRVDYNINANNKMFGRFNLRNLLTVNNASGNLPVQFPGDSLTATDIERDRAWVVGETWTVNSNVINQLTIGETRANLQEPIQEPSTYPAGGYLYELSFFGAFEGDTFATPFERPSASGRVVPDPTVRDDVTFIRGKHTFQFGAQWNPVKVRSLLVNDLDFVQEGLGGDIESLTPAYRPANISTSDFAESNWDNFFLGELGLIWNHQASINYNAAGDPLPFGSQATRDWRIYEMAGYAGDSWRFRPDLTITAGVRYQYQTAPYEVHGVEAQFFNQSFNSLVDARVSAGLAGATGIGATPLITYQEAGKGNHNGAPLYAPEKHDFSPRLALAWNPSFANGILGRLFGDHKSVVRAGGSFLYDESVIYAITNYEDQSNYLFANTIADEFNSGATTLTALTTDPRMNSLATPPYAIPAPAFTTPLTPFAIFNDGIDPKLKTPYSITASLGVQRELPGGFQLEADYFGRFGRRLLQLGDAGQALNFVDATPDHESLVTAFSYLENESRLPGNPNTIAAGLTPQPFFETNMNNALAAQGNGTCATFYAPFPAGVTPNCTNAVFLNNGTALQNGGTGGILPALPLPTNVGLNPQFYVDAIMANKGFSDYNSLIMTLRKRLSNNLQFDINYTFSHSIDNGSTVSDEDGNFASGVTSVMCDVTNNRGCRGNSEFDATHQISAEFVYSLPFGRGQTFGRNVNTWVNEAIGGWTVSGIQTWRTGLAFTANDTNFAAFDTVSLSADTGVLMTGTRADLGTHLHIDTNNNDALQFYSNPTLAAAQFSPVTGLQNPDRDTLRGPHFSNLDLSVSKLFPLGSERFNLKFVAEAYNAFNHPNFGIPNTGVIGSQFGVISGQAGAEPDRVMQFALRLDF